MADLVTRIIAEDKQFNDKIERSKKQTKQFGETGKLAQGALLKMAGAMGVAASAGAAFDKTIKSTQGSADKFETTLGAARSTVDQFFKSMSDGDFSVFFHGLDGLYDKALKAQQALDQLWNTQNSYTRATAKTRLTITSARADAYDPELPKGERLAAVESWKTAIGELDEYAKTYRDDLETTIKSITSTYSLLRPEDVTLQDVDFATLLDARGTIRDSVKAKAAEDMAAYQAELTRIAAENTTTITQGTNYGTISQDILSDEGLRLQQEAAKKYQNSIVINTLLGRMTDEELKDITDKLNTYDQINQDLENNRLELNRSLPRLQSRIENESKAGTGSAVVEQLAQGSIAQLEQQISEAQKVFMNATTDEARRSADELIKSLESRKAFIEIGFKYPGGVGNIQQGSSLLNTSGIKEIPDIDMSGVVQPLDYEPVSTYSDYVYEAARRNEDLTSSLYSMGDAMSSISNIVGEGAGAWLQYGASVLQAVGQGLPAILAMTAAKKAEATANAASAATGAASSVAGIPIVGPILAISAVASIVAALANLPKFATGGIVGGSSFSGDNVLARVNSGELILNASQQKNLAGALTGGNVRFEIEGKTLVGVLNNEGARRSRR